MNKILLNILMVVGFQQFILGTEANKEPETKLGFCLSCYLINCDQTHDIPSVFNEESCKECVKQVYSVCSKGHTICESCIIERINNDIKENMGIVRCYTCSEEIKESLIQNILSKPMEEKNIQKCENLLKKYNKLLEERQLEKKINKDPNLRRCDYPNCKGYFSINKWGVFFTKTPICNKNKKHIHCKKCFRKKHKGECMSEFDEIIKRNREIREKKNNNELQQGDSEGYKPCPKCLVITEKISGCNHMTCVYCKHQWCWRCGATCFIDDPNKEGYNHYGGTAEKPNSECRGKHDVYEKNEEDGNYFGISNGNFENDFKYLEKNKRILIHKYNSYIENNCQQCCDNCTNFFENFL